MSDFFRRVLGAWQQENDPTLVEGTVVRAKAEIMDALNGVAKELVEMSQGFGLETQAFYVRDVADAVVPAKVMVQLGTSGASAWMTVSVYDNSDIKARVPQKIANRLHIEPYLSFESPQEAFDYLKKVYKWIVRSRRQT